MKFRIVRTLIFGISILFILNFSFVGGVRNFFSAVASAFTTGIPQKLPVIQANEDGSASTSVSIELPPGTKGVIPDLSLSYNSNGGNGIVGMGWSLNGIHTISRNPSYGIQYNGTDQFVSSLAGELVDVSGNRSEFHSRKESWIRFVPQGSCGDGPCSWVATDKDGKRYSFGGTADSRISAIGRGAGSLREWALNREEDSFGNGYNVTYTPADSTSGDYYPQRISYNNRTIDFTFENRNDKYPNYSQGSIVRTQKRLDSIEVSIAGSSFRKYDFDYGYGPVTHRSLLQTIKRSGSNAFGSESYDDLSFTYSDHAGQFSVSGVDSVNRSNLFPMSVYIPDAIMDIANVYFNQELPYHPTAKDINVDLDMQYVVRMPVPDRNACNLGLAACLCAAYLPCTGGNPDVFAYVAGACVSFGGWGGINGCLNGNDAALVAWIPMDINGDGIGDFVSLNGVESSGSVHLSANILRAGSPSSGNINSANLPIYYNTYFQTADLNGDGRTDFGYESGGKLWAVYSTGSGFSSPVVFGNVNIDGAVRNMTQFSPYEYKFEYSAKNPTPIANDKSLRDFFADVNGDELVDFVHYNGGAFSIYINRKTYFDNAINIAGDADFFLNFMLDFNGDGKADHVQLVQNYDNSALIGLKAQRDALSSQMDTIQQEYYRAQAVVDLIATGNNGAINPIEFQFLIDFYNNNCGLGCLFTIWALQGSNNGASLTPSDAAVYSNDLQTITSSRINPLAQQSQVIASQIGAIAASGQGGAFYTLKVRSFHLSNGTSSVRVYSLGGSIDPNKSTVADVNGDGNLDFVTFTGTQIAVSLFRGGDFASPVYSGLNSGDSSKLVQFNFGDVNGDGLPDLVLMNKENSRYETYLSLGDGSFARNNSYSFGGFSLNEYTEANGTERSDTYQIWLNDLNNDGISDLTVGFVNVDKTYGAVSFRYNAARSSGEDMILSTSNNSGGQRSLVQYQLKDAHAGAVSVGSGDYPNIPSVGPGFLAVSTTQELGAGIVKNSSYQYTNQRYFLGSRSVSRGLGFASVKETDLGTNFYSITDYFQNDYRLAGFPQSERSYNALGNLMSSTTNSSFSFPNPFGTEIAVPGNVVSNDYNNGVLTTSVLKTFAYDSFGFNTSTTEDFGSNTITNTTQVLHDTAAWRIGRVVRTKKIVDGTLVSDTLRTYSGDNVVTQTQFASSGFSLASNFAYDSFGNVISITESSGAVSTITYDSTLNFYPVTKTNALGHVSTNVFDTELGVEISSTDPNGATHSKTYDAYGRILSVTYPGESSANETYVYNNTGLYDLTTLSNNESVTKNTIDTTSGNTSTTTKYMDPLGNTIRTESNTAVSGILSIEESFYDYNKGQLIKKSNEYYSNIAPQYTLYQYNDPDGELSTITEPHSLGTIQTNITRSGLTETKNTIYPDGQTKSESITKNALGQVTNRTVQGRSIQYTYSPFGGYASITDPSGLVTSFGYNSVGQRTSTQDPNSGTISYSYDANGRLSRQTDARGKSVNFSYDLMGRNTAQTTNGPEVPIQFVYDDSSVPFSLGRLTKVTDESGQTEFRYNQKGNQIQKTKRVDDIVAIFKTDYDSLNRPITETLPDGTKLHNNYSTNGTLSNITMDSADGTSVGHTVVSYQGPYLNANGVPSVRRVSGNGVTMEIGFEPLEKLPVSILSTKPDGSVIANSELTYDAKNNLTKIDDRLNPSRTQNFTLDNLNRVTQATGKYGTQNYNFATNGNLTQKGAYTLSYGDGTHANAVTTANSPSTGTLNYGYDASGNMISRNGDTLRYNSYGKLIEITPYGTSSSILNTYDYTGSRIKSESQISLVTTYTLGSNYEIVRNPGQPERHTLYVRGLQGDLVAQWTRDDATLQLAQMEGTPEPSSSSIGQFVGRIVGTATEPFCKGVAIDCADYYKNRIKDRVSSVFGYSELFQEGVPTKVYNAFYFLLLLTVLYLSYPYFLKGNELLQRLSWQGVGTPAALVALFVVTSIPGCGVLPGSGGKEGDPPWVLAMGANVNPGTPSIQNPNAGTTGGGNIGGTPVNGMYFYHPDHLGSINMITDGYGNPASGPEPGVSYVSYEPYGSINRNDSYGPDIFRYKYTGQIEDKETGLYYYKSRYYEPILGRFLQADSIVAPESTSGMNRYMYVDGNPVNYRDPSGHLSGSGLMHMVNRIIGHAMGKDFNSKGMDKRLSARGISTGGNRFFHNATFVKKGRYYWDVGNTIFSQRKIGSWWRNFMGNDVQNTANYQSGQLIASWSKSKACADSLGADACAVLFVANLMVMKSYSAKHDRLSEPLRGMIDSNFNPGQRISSFFTKGGNVNCKSSKTLSEGYYTGEYYYNHGGIAGTDGSIRRSSKEVDIISSIFLVYSFCQATSGE
ncbi:RHS repeat-associated core domain-containing protein [Leptospira sanjuanensis]|uniref:RHS repeat-associated core domain-containing protein n=1 Tax=Leptospira sanjuanensis TaxID=2879643 RepID=UPI001EE8A2A3|nr:RHS repeat-associated core domain-containing protein [Leptospira sanjuanensis]MCG6167536.1 FG-GAP-like repeat-containing protein [Leptospira sanjuanensis]